MPRFQKDPGSWIPGIQDTSFCGILDLMFSFSRGILEILDLVTAALSRDPRDLGSQTEKMLLDAVDHGSYDCVAGSCRSCTLNIHFVVRSCSVRS